MGENSKIEWTDHTFNPWVGCQKVSPGCKLCYAERDFTRKPRWANTWGPPEISERIRTSAENWRKPLAWNRQARAESRRYRVFCASLGDIFEDNPQVESWREDLWALISETTALDWLLLTKRPENVLRFLPWPWNNARAGGCPPHVWIGTSVENQAAADERIPYLLRVPSVVRFLSCEPLLGPVDLDGYIGTDIQLSDAQEDIGDGVDWIIVGGESGHHARPMHPDWARQLLDQASAESIPYFFKQWGEWLHPSQSAHMPLEDLQGATGRRFWDDGSTSYRIGKKRAGRLLDGELWSQMPAVS